jgi:Ca2+-binding EF-hand superfamily protein
MAIENSKKLSKEEIDLLLKTYDQDKSGDLSDEEIKKVVSDYNENKTTELDSKLISVLQKYDKDKGIYLFYNNYRI